MKMKFKQLVAAGLFCIAGVACAALPGFTTMYVFGDSLSDAGNFTNGGYPTVNNAPITNSVAQGGTNAGKLWDMSGAVGIFNVTPSNQGGTDYAWAYAQTGSQTVTAPIPIPNPSNPSKPNYITLPTLGLQNQVGQYLARNGRANPAALYVIWAGSNDILDLIFNPANPQNPAQVINNGMINIIAAVSNLYQAGARNFLVIGVPNIALTPISAPNASATEQATGIGVLYGPNGSLATALSNACNSWDAILFANGTTPATGPLHYLKRVLPGINLYAWNPATLSSVLLNPTSAGFPATTYNRNGSPGPNNQTTLVYGTLTGQDSNADDFLFYNFIHPTGKAHLVIAQAIASNAISIQ